MRLTIAREQVRTAIRQTSQEIYGNLQEGSPIVVVQILEARKAGLIKEQEMLENVK